MVRGAAGESSRTDGNGPRFGCKRLRGSHRKTREGIDPALQMREDRTIAGTPFIFLTAKGEKTDLRAGMNLGADDYLTKPASATELLIAISVRLERELKRPAADFNPDFSSAAPLERAFGLTAREAEVLLWVAQGKSNPEISSILGAAENTIKKHLQHIFEKMGVDNRNAATLRTLEVLPRAS